LLNLLVGIAVVPLMTSCLTDLGTSTYKSSDLGHAQSTLHGVVLSVRKVAIEGTSVVAPAVGAGLGSVAGALVGGTGNRLAGAAIGGVAGAVGGHLIKPKSNREGFEYEVRADNGRIYTIVQGPDIKLNVGERVSIVFADGSSRGRLLPCGDAGPI
jgi:outer membrane lipoprotein SlyB